MLLSFYNADCAGEKKVLAYFKSGDLATIPTDDVDYLLFAFAFVDKVEIFILTSLIKLHRFDAALPVIQKRGLKALISVGGYEHSSNFPIIAADEQARQHFAASVAAFILKYQLDGVDIDWEFKTCEEAKNYAKLVNAVKKENQDKVLTITVFRRPSRMTCVDYTQIDAAVNYYNLLTYEYYGAEWSSKTGFNTPLKHVDGDPSDLYIKITTDTFLGLEGVSKSKVLLGLAFYGQQFCQTKGLFEPFDKKCSDSKRIDYKDIANVSTAVYNDQAEAVSIYDATKERLTTFDNIKSIGDKCEYIIDQGVAGAFVWELGADKNSELLSVVRSTLKPPPNSGYYCQAL